jgi:mannitol-specific phosphotransferase system IIBC component
LTSLKFHLCAIALMVSLYILNEFITLTANPIIYLVYSADFERAQYISKILGLITAAIIDFFFALGQLYLFSSISKKQEKRRAESSA